MNVGTIRSISMSRGRKPKAKAAIPINISMPPLLHHELMKVIQSHGFCGPSDYFQSCVRADAGLGLSPHATKEIQSLPHEQESG